MKKLGSKNIVERHALRIILGTLVIALLLLSVNSVVANSTKQIKNVSTLTEIPFSNRLPPQKLHGVAPLTSKSIPQYGKSIANVKVRGSKQLTHIPKPRAIPFHKMPPPEELHGIAPLSNKSTLQYGNTTSSLAPYLSGSFLGIGEGLNFYQPGFPPDTMGAAGPSYLMEMTNDEVEIFDNSTGAPIHSDLLEDFWSNQPDGLGTGAGQPDCDNSDNDTPTCYPFDPKVIYDQYTGHYIAVTMNNDSSTPDSSWIMLAVSANSDPTGGWYKWAIDADMDNGTQLYHDMADFPGLGIDADNVYITARMYNGDKFNVSKVWVIPKSQLLSDQRTASNAPPTVYEFRDPTGSGFSTQPAHVFGSSSAEYLISEGGSFPGIPPRRFLNISSITFSGGTPTWNYLGRIEVNSYPTASTPNAPQLASSHLIDTDDTRLLNAVFINGSLWTTHTVSDNTNSKTEVSWYQIDPADASVSPTGPYLPPIQEGRISDPNRWYYYPSIAVNSSGYVVIGFSGSSTSEYVGAYYTARNASDAPGTMQAVRMLKNGKAPYNRVDDQGIARWGDYSATVVDPTDDTTFWTVQEYAWYFDPNRDPNSYWGTYWGKISPHSLSISASQDTVIVKKPTDVTFNVTFSNGTAASGATVTLSGNATGTGTTDATGSTVIGVNATDGGTIYATANMTGYENATTTLTAVYGPFAYIPNTGSSNISVIDTASDTIVGTAPAENFPIGVAVSRDGEKVYVTNEDNGSIYAYALDQSAKTIYYRPLVYWLPCKYNFGGTVVYVAPGPDGVAVNPTGNDIYVTIPDNGYCYATYDDKIVNFQVINTTTGQTEAALLLGSRNSYNDASYGGSPQGVAINTDGTKVYVATTDDNNVSVIDTTTNTVDAIVNVGSIPNGVAVTPDGTSVYVANSGDNTVSVIDTATNAVTATVQVGNYPSGIAVNPAGTEVYVANSHSNNVFVIDTATNEVNATVNVGTDPWDVGVSPDGTKVYAVNHGDNTVSVINTTTNNVTATVPVGTAPGAFGQFIAPFSLIVTANRSEVTVGTPTNVTFLVMSQGGTVEKPESDVTVTLSGNATGTNTTDANGIAIISVNATAAGTITANASKIGYLNGTTTLTAIEPILSVTANPAEVLLGIPTSVTFTVTSNGNAVSGATVTLSGNATGTGTTDATGTTTISVAATAAGTITANASKTGYTDGTTTLTATDTGMTGTVSFDSSGLPISGATVTAGGVTAITDDTGVYSMGIAPGTYDVTINKTGWVKPPPATGVVVNPGINTQNFSLWQLNVTRLSQGDPLWAMDTYDNAPYWVQYPTPQKNISISRWGCALTSTTMVLRYYGVDTDPSKLNYWLNNTGGYTKKGWVRWENVTNYPEAKGKVSYDAKDQKTNITLGNWSAFKPMVDRELRDGHPVIAGVKSGGKTPGHWVVITGKTEVNGVETYTINDPGGYVPERTTLLDYNDQVYSIRIYKPYAKSTKILQIIGQSPIELYVTDPFGRHTGIDPLSGLEVNEIPNSSYYHESIFDEIYNESSPDIKILEVSDPVNGDYNLSVIGTDTGDYSIDVDSYDEFGNLNSIGNFSGNTSAGNIQSIIFSVNSGVSSAQVESSTGEGTVFFSTDNGTIENLTAINVSDIPEAPPSGANLYYGLFGFNITGITPGSSVNLTLLFPSNLPANTAYWKYGANASNTTPHWYTIPSIINGNTLTFSLTDGGTGDDDLAANGIIQDDSGPSIPPQHLVSINVTPSTATLTAGGNQTFNATALDQNGNPMTGINISWTVSNSTVGNVTPLFAITDSNGNASATFNAYEAGTVMVNATNGSVNGDASVTVNPITPTSTPTLSVTANPSSVIVGIPTDVIFNVTSNGTAVSGATVTLSGSAIGIGITNATGSITMSVNATSAGPIYATASAAGYTSGTIIVTATTAATIGAGTITVNASGGADYTRIQDAINNANNGDIILVQSGTYYENVNVNKPLILIGKDTGGGLPIVEGNYRNAITLSAGNSILRNFTTVNGWIGIYVISNNNILSGNTASNNHYDGIDLSGSSNNTLSNNNALNNYNRGIDLSSSSNNTLTSNTANSNMNYGGIELDSSSNNTLSGNIANSNNNGDGIWLASSNNNNLTGNIANWNNAGNGIELDGSSNNLTGNIANSNYNGYGIYLSGSNNNLTGNTMSGNQYNFGIIGYSDSNFNNTIDTSNTVDSKPIYYIKSATNRVYDSSTNAGTFYCISCNNVTIQDLTLTKNDAGIYLRQTQNSIIKNILASNNYYGIYLSGSSNNTLSGSTASNDGMGIYLSGSSNNTLSGNTANSNNNGYGIGDGIYLSGSSNNTLGGDTASNNYYGIYLSGSSNNTLSGNTVSNNFVGIYLLLFYNGIELDTSSNNLIYNNNFNNTNNFYFYGSSTNTWNITKTLGKNIVGGSYLSGNFWASSSGTGFSQTCMDSDNDGICDSSYSLSSNNTDYLPLTYKPASLTSIVISPSSASLIVGGTQQFNVTALDQNNNIMAGVNITWTSSNSSVGNITPVSAVTDSNGKASATFTGIAAGTAIVNVTNGTVSGSANVIVTTPTLTPTPTPTPTPSPTPTGPDFMLSVSPSTLALAPGSSASFAISVASLLGFSEAVNLSVESLPMGVTASFFPATVNPSGTSILVLTANSSAATGSFPLMITGTGGGISHTTNGTVSLNFGLVPICYGTFSGSITDRETGLPAAGVPVEASGIETLTSDSGYYTLNNVSLGENNAPLTYTLIAAPQFNAAFWQGSASGTAICGVTTTVDLQVLRKKNGTVSGFVQGEDFATGQITPLSGVSVILYFQDTFSSQATTTGEDGTYQSGPLQLNPDNAPANYTAIVQKDGYWTIRDNILVQADQDTKLNTTLVSQCNSRINATVYADGEPASGTFEAQQPIYDQYGLLETLDDGPFPFNGKFSLGVPLGYNNSAGYYNIQVVLIGGIVGGKIIPVSTCGETINTTINLVSGGNGTAPPSYYYGWVQGHVYDQETDLPLANVSVSGAVTDANGYYNLQESFANNNTTENFSLYAYLESYWPSSGEVAVTTNQTSTLDFYLLRKQYGAIAGTVRDIATRDPISNAIVELPGTVPTGTDGAYQAAGMELNPGNQPRSINFQTYAPGYWPNVSQATISANQTTSMDIDLIKVCQGATINGTVVNAVTLAPIEGATVSAGGKSTTTDNNGMFYLSDLTVGNDNSPMQVIVIASAAGFYPQSKTVTIFCGATITLDFGQPQTEWGTIIGTVTSSQTGGPLPGVFIGSEFGNSTTTDQTGNYRLDKAPLGPNNTDRVWQVTAIYPNAPEQTKSVTVTANQEVRADFQFDVPANILPVAQDQSVTTKEDTAENITLNASDSDGDALTLSLVTLPAHGTLSGATPNLTYTPQSGFVGNDSFTFKANDGKADSNTATVSITVIPVAPIATNDTYTMDEDSILNVPAPGILGNDIAANGNTLTATLVSEPNHGTLMLNSNGSFTYIPNASYYGEDSFTYIANDSKLDSNIATVSITINQSIPTNAAPYLTSIMVLPPTASLITGGTQQFNATVLDQNNNPMTGINISWTVSNSTVGNVTPLFAVTGSDGNASATFNASVVGTAIVNATNGSVNGSASVTVSPVPPALTTIIVTPSKASLTVSGTQQFNATALDQNNKPMSGINISWAINDSAIGSVTPLFAITGSDGNASATFISSAAGAAMVNASNGSVVGSANVLVNRITPTITWNNPANITYGTALGSTQLNATASVPGSFTYTPASGTVLGAGSNQNLHVDFTPSDATNYTGVSANVKINVLKAKSTVTWSNPANITYGIPLSATQLNATASVPGSFTYTPASGTVLSAGNNQNLHVDFTPTDIANYTNASANVIINVKQAVPSITWANPADIPYGTPLSATQLDAVAIFSGTQVIGTYNYNPAAGTILNIGTGQTLTVNFMPTDSTNYTGATASVKINVTKVLATTIVTVSQNKQQYSDLVNFTATLSPAVANTIPAKTVTFFVGTQNMGTATLINTGGNLQGILTNVPLLEPTPFGTLPIGQMSPGLHTVTATFGGVDSNNFTVTNATASLNITQEDARDTYTGDLYVSTSSYNSTTATVTLAATIQDISVVPNDPAYDPYPGDIRNANVTFINRDTGAVLASNVPVGLINSSDTKNGTAVANWKTTISCSYSPCAQSYTIGIIVGNYYIRNSSVDDTVVTVVQPGNGSITGGGYLVLNNSAGILSGDKYTKNNFGFNVKYNKGGTNLQGNINTIIRQTNATDGLQHIYQIKGNSMTQLTVNTSSVPATATFNGKASIQDITNPSNIISIDGNAQLQVTLTDYGQATKDTIGITVWNKNGGLYFSSNWNGVKTVEQTLGGGNLAIH